MVAANIETLSPSQHDHRLVVGKRNAREKLSTCLNCVIQETAEQLSADSTSPPFIASGERKAAGGLVDTMSQSLRLLL